jgi:thiaminase
MAAAYVRAAQLEWMFWDACYAGEDWPQAVRV